LRKGETKTTDYEFQRERDVCFGSYLIECVAVSDLSSLKHIPTRRIQKLFCNSRTLFLYLFTALAARSRNRRHKVRYL